MVVAALLLYIEQDTRSSNVVKPPCKSPSSTFPDMHMQMLRHVHGKEVMSTLAHGDHYF